jgi:hypothetical protein
VASNQFLEELPQRMRFRNHASWLLKSWLLKAALSGLSKSS